MPLITGETLLHVSGGHCTATLKSSEVLLLKPVPNDQQLRMWS